MKILHVYKTSLPASYGGIESFIDTLCKATSKLNIQNDVLTLHPQPAEKPIKMDGYSVHQAKQNLFLASTGFSFSAFGKFKELASDADIIHYQFPNPFQDMLHLTYSPQKPSIVTYQSYIIKQKHLNKLYSPLKKKFLDSMSHIVATSANYMHTSTTLQQYKNKISIIPNGIDQRSYNTVDPERLKYWRGRLHEPFFLFVGALRYYKGLHTALAAIANTDIRLVISGCGGIESDLKAQANSLKLQNVDFLGSVSEEDKLALLHLCYGFIFPSHLRSEAFGISLLEAASVGKPLISCEIGTGTTFINIANETGLVVKPESPDELREAMLYLLGNQETAISMGKNARERSVKYFSAEQIGKSYSDLYKSLLHSNQHQQV